MAQLAAQGGRFNLKLLFDGDGSNRFRNQRKLLRLSGHCCGGVEIRGCARKLRFLRVNGCLGDDGYEGDDELACFKGLVLDLAYRPVNVVCWKSAICLEFMEKADVLEYYDQKVNSPSGSFNIPAVLRVPDFLQVIKRRRIRSTLNRKNILYRDSYTCQYCSSRENLTVDHVLPVARGGEWKWENLAILDVALGSSVHCYREHGVPRKWEVAACARCNSRKGQKTIDEANMKLINIPEAPRDYDMLATPLTGESIRMLRLRKGTPEEWRQYLAKPYSGK